MADSGDALAPLPEGMTFEVPDTVEALLAPNPGPLTLNGVRSVRQWMHEHKHVNPLSDFQRDQARAGLVASYAEAGVNLYTREVVVAAWLEVRLLYSGITKVGRETGQPVDVILPAIHRMALLLEDISEQVFTPEELAL